jgi:hypothetical protein
MEIVLFILMALRIFQETDDRLPCMGSHKLTNSAQSSTK